jgi:hypothetical protein
MSDLTCRPVGGLEEVFAADRAARERADGWLRATRRAPPAAPRQALRS